MSNDVPPTAPGSPEPDPFAELLKGLVNEPTAPAPAQPAPPAAPGADLPPTEAMPMPDLRPASFPPVAPSGPIAPSEPTQPTVAYQPPAAPQAPPTIAYPQPTSPTIAYQPTQPTTAYSQSGYEQPTEVLGGLGGFGAVPPTTPTTAWTLSADEGPEPFPTRRKVLVGILIAVAAILVVAIAILVTVLALGPKGGAAPTTTPSHSTPPSSSPTASDSPSPTPSPTPEAVATIDAFTAKSNTVQCPYDKSGTQQVLLSWSVTNATEVAVGSAAAQVDAIDQPYQNNLDPAATDFAIPYVCTNPTWSYTLTAATPGGEHISTVVSITASYAAPPPPPPPAPSTTNAAFVDGTDYVTCSSFDTGELVTKEVSWTATPADAKVDVYLAQSNDAYPDANASYTKVAEAMSASGQTGVQIDCGTTGYGSYFAMKIVATSPGGTTSKYLKGNTAS